MVRVNLDPHDEGLSHPMVLAYGVCALVFGAVIFAIAASVGGTRNSFAMIGVLGMFLGGCALIIGLIWMAIAPRSVMGESRPNEAFLADIIAAYELGGRASVVELLQSKGDNLQAKGALRLLRNRSGIFDPALKEICGALAEYCSDPVRSRLN